MKKSVEFIQSMKQANQKIAMLTAYDCPTARVLNEAELDVILVGDSLGMVVLGFEDTRSVTMADMLHHTRAVARGNTECLLIADLPYRTYETPSDAVKNARMLRDAGADAVKPEGKKLESIKAIVADGIPVVGHVGLLPQTSETFRVHGRKPSEAVQIVDDAKALQAAGCFAVVLEGIPARLAKEITGVLRIPTIGIGAGAACDGQVLVLHDLIGFFDQFNPTFAKKYADLGRDLKRAVSHYRSEVKRGLFPDKEHTYN
ncbi:MAG: 3-methyl-2-oxobutanoate hydroxymethyltransferase [Candidatus Poribacteria bacterium]|nr:3-methyl-2-oxobutanoate hydroxymethyltransferase [Candidatus Poribacteria bacterium]MDE0506934.1 3-methyl-2-oxobutanoate hydroxymethyltransferase [Candidatus Poribacteria bacterium]